MKGFALLTDTSGTRLLIPINKIDAVVELEETSMVTVVVLNDSPTQVLGSFDEVMAAIEGAVGSQD